MRTGNWCRGTFTYPRPKIPHSHQCNLATLRNTALHLSRTSWFLSFLIYKAMMTVDKKTIDSRSLANCQTWWKWKGAAAEGMDKHRLLLFYLNDLTISPWIHFILQTSQTSGYKNTLKLNCHQTLIWFSLYCFYFWSYIWFSPNYSCFHESGAASADDSLQCSPVKS